MHRVFLIILRRLIVLGAICALYEWDWTGATPGEHTLVSRVTDTNGAVQPTAAELSNKKTFLEDNSQHPRKVMIS